MKGDSQGRGILDRIRDEARRQTCTIVLPEPSDPRVMEAAGILMAERLADVILVGTPERGAELSAARWVDPRDPLWLEPLAGQLYEARRARGLDLAGARELAANPLYCAGGMIARGEAAAGVAGSLATTADVIRAGLHTIGTLPGRKLVSSFFLMELLDGRVTAFADCAVVPQPDPQQLAEIAVTTASSFQRLTGELPRVAMLSFSTAGSAEHADVRKVVEALRIAKQLAPALVIDGELQFDAAFDPAVAQRKSPASPVAGQANVFVFPDLDAGNIGYKIAQRMGGAQAIGPLVQGLKRPFMDLSRGCTTEVIVNVAAVAAVLSR